MYGKLGSSIISTCNYFLDSRGLEKLFGACFKREEIERLNGCVYNSKHGRQELKESLGARPCNIVGLVLLFCIACVQADMRNGNGGSI